MRRGAPPPQLPVDIGPAPALARVDRGPRGLVLREAAPPEGAVLDLDPATWRLDAGSPLPLRMAALASDGAQGVGVAARGEVAHSLDLRPRLRGIHDRRPPGLDRAVAIPRANAALLHSDDGWRLVVLASLGDVVADLGRGPVAITADAGRVAVPDAEGVAEHRVADGQLEVHHPGPVPAALAYADGRLWAARGAAVVGLGTPAAAAGETGAAITALVGAAGAAVVAAQHADGQISIWETTGEVPVRRAAWRPPAGAGELWGLSVDGATVELGDPAGEQPAAAIVRAQTGAIVRLVIGARTISQAAAAEVMLLAGDWGCATMIPETGDH